MAAALCCRYYFAVAENAKTRVEAFEFQQLAESIQPQLVAKRQQLQAQQEKLNKGSAISQTVGPAVLGDIRSAADKGNNAKLKELLAKYGVRESGVAGTPGVTSAPGGAASGGVGKPAVGGETGPTGASKKGGN